MSTVNFNPDKKRRYPGLCTTMMGKSIKPPERVKSSLPDKDEVESILKEPGKKSSKGNSTIALAFKQPEKESGEGNSMIWSASKQTEKEIIDRLRQELHPNQMTPEELAAHNKKCDESEGFDVPDVPSHIVDNVLRPSHLQDVPAALELAFGDMSKIALEDYNRVKGTPYQFVKVIKVNTEYSGAVWHYVNFQAKKDGCPPQNFQARICPHRGVEKMVEFSLWRGETRRTFGAMGSLVKDAGEALVACALGMF
ncbi:hypothetical protein Vadar_009376 [Vaccinium darrowii]|uniref:Uncharacterized protein n=1 Tax=Vaccinium darrowii TaxID=229202 RepID=A0ACB7Y6F6_9ERIC|nr:hypothetical protein Vadar_009376 [Vaccinium darrowii]